jgi:hypothetical protein
MRKREEMIISFSGKWARDTETFGISFEATVDGAQVQCRVDTDALQDIDPSNATSDPESQFTLNQFFFQEIAETLIRDGRLKDGQLFIGGVDVRA